MSATQVLKLMKDKEVEYVDLRFTDPRGKLQHLTMDATIVEEKMLNKYTEGIVKKESKVNSLVKEVNQILKSSK